MSRYVDTDGGPDSVSIEDRWYLQQRGQLPDGWPELGVDEIAELSPPRHEAEVQASIAEQEYTGVADQSGPDSGPERDALARPGGLVGSTYVPDLVAEVEALRAELAARDAAGEVGAAAFGTEVLSDAPELSEREQAKADRIAERQATTGGASGDHAAAADNVRADPDRIAITAAERGPAALAAGTTELPVGSTDATVRSALAQQQAQSQLGERKTGRGRRRGGEDKPEPASGTGGESDAG